MKYLSSFRILSLYCGAILIFLSSVTPVQTQSIVNTSPTLFANLPQENTITGTLPVVTTSILVTTGTQALPTEDTVQEKPIPQETNNNTVATSTPNISVSFLAQIFTIGLAGAMLLLYMIHILGKK